MQNISKGKLTVLFLSLSILATTQTKTKMPSLKELLSNKQEMFVVGLIGLAIIPMYQLYSKSPKKNINPEEDYSWEEIKEALQTIVENLAGTLRIKKSKLANEEVKKAWNLLRKNIKNLYNMGFVGQISRDPVLKTDDKVIKWTESIAARGFLGNFVGQLSDLRKATKEIASLVAIAYVIKSLYAGDKKIITPEIKPYSISIS